MADRADRIDHRRPVDRPTLLRLTAWRLLVAAFGAAGVVGAVYGQDVGVEMEALSQQASLAAAMIYLGLAVYPFTRGARFHEPRSPWWRGAIAVTMLLILVVYKTLLDSDYSEPHSLFEHVLTPVAVTVDVLAVGRNLLNAGWWSVLSWLAFPLAYLLYYNAFGLDVYSFPLRFGQADFLDYFPGLLGGTVVAGALIVAVGRVRAARGAAA